MEKKEDLITFFPRVDQIVGVLISPGVHMPVEDVNLKTGEVLTSTSRASTIGDPPG